MLLAAIRRHVFTAELLHVDDTIVPVLAISKAITGRIRTSVRDDRPFGGHDPPAALFYSSRARRGNDPPARLAGWTGIMQADAFAAFDNSTSRDDPPHRSSKPHAGATAGESFSISPSRPKADRL